MNKVRLAAAVLSLSAAGFIGIVVDEHYTETAVIPVKNDRPTVGLGSTFHEDGSPVRMGDKTTPVGAIRKSYAHIAKIEIGLKRCITGELSQLEYNIVVDFAYQYGINAACNSAMVRHINAGKYRQSCEAYTAFRYITTTNKTPGWEPYKFDASGKPIRWRFDCSIDGNKVCSGVWKRSLNRKQKCLEGLS